MFVLTVPPCTFEQVSPALGSATLKDLGVSEEKAAFKFHKPDSVEVVGSYDSQTITKPLQSIDLAVRMPKVLSCPVLWFEYPHSRSCLCLEGLEFRSALFR